MPRSKKLNEEMRAKSQATYLQAGKTLFAELGFHNTRINDIAKAAQTSPGNFYLYYEDKYSLLGEILQAGFDELETLMQAAAESSAFPTRKLDQVVEDLLSFYRREPEFQVIFLSMLSTTQGQEEVQRMGIDLDQLGAAYRSQLSAIIAEVAGFPQGRAEELVLMDFFAYLNGLVLTYAKDLDQVPLKHIQRVVRGLCIPPQGDELRDE